MYSDVLFWDGCLISWLIIFLSRPPEVRTLPFQDNVPILDSCYYQKSIIFLVFTSKILIYPVDSPAANKLPVWFVEIDVTISFGSYKVYNLFALAVIAFQRYMLFSRPTETIF